jgi:hypothetical protein
MAEPKEFRAEIKDKTGAADSFIKSIGTGSGLCIGVCVGIIILILILAGLVALGSSNNDKDNIKVETSQGTANNQMTPQQAAVKKEFLAEGLSSNIEVNGIKVAILNAYSVLSDKKTKYYFEISSENNSKEDVYTPSNSSFQIEDEKNYVTDSTLSWGLDDAYPYFQKLAPTQKVKGFVFFEINKDEKPKNLVLKQWNLFGNDRLLRWRILDSDIKQIECMTEYDCPNTLYQECKNLKCVWKAGYCGKDSDCPENQKCIYNTCSSSYFG